MLQSSSEAIGAKYPNNMRAGYSSIANFPQPAIVTWRSKDGTPHHAEVDIGDIFKDRLIRHNLQREEISETSSISNPGRSEEHTSDLQSLMRNSIAVFCLKKKNRTQ